MRKWIAFILLFSLLLGQTVYAQEVWTEDESVLENQEESQEPESEESDVWADDEVPLIQNGDLFTQHFDVESGIEERSIPDWQQILKRRLIDAFSNYEEKVSLEDLELNRDEDYHEMRSVYQASIVGQFFYISGGYSYSYSASTGLIKYIKINYNSEYLDDNGEVDVHHIEKDKESFDYQVEKALNCLDGAESDLEKVLLLHDFIVRECDYDYENYLNNSIPRASFNAYGVLVNGKAVCNGYAFAYSWLLQQCDIESYIVVSDSMNHAWNLVNVDGSWYHVDATWDDPIFKEKTYRSLYNLDYADEGFVTHTYFLCSDDEFLNLRHSGWEIETNGEEVPSADKSDVFSEYLFKTNPVSSFAFIDQQWYCFDLNKGNLISSSSLMQTDSSIAKTNVLRYGFGYERKIYYNTTEAVFTFDPKNEETDVVWKPENSSEVISEMSIKNGYLICVTLDDENETNRYQNYISTLQEYPVPNEISFSDIQVNKDSIILTWSTNEKADGYIVTCSDSMEGEYKELAIINNYKVTSYEDKVKDGQWHYYKICTYRLYDDERICSPYSESVSAKANSAEPEMPKLGKAENDTDGNIRINWSPVDGAEGYRIYRKENGKGWKGLTNVGADAVSYTDQSGITGTKYTYTIRAYVMNKDKMMLSSYDQLGVSAQKLPGQVKLVSAKDNGNSEIVISWEKMKDADGYRIYRKENGKGWSGLGNTSELIFTDKAIDVGTKYTYTVRAYKNVAGTNVYGSYDKTGKSAVCLPKTAVLVSAEDNGNGGIEIQWEKVRAADGYRIYRKTSTEGWKALDNVNNADKTTFLDSSGDIGTVYIYTVRAYKKNGETVLYGDFDHKGISARKVPVTVKLISAEYDKNNGAEINWEKVEQCTGYVIYRKTGTSSWRRLAKVTEKNICNFADKSVQSSALYTYTIRAYQDVKGKEVLGGFDKLGIKVECK
ncbi:transglutaminase domain-containing protein [Coprococcus catus]|uniref:transglutaminase domain-containing protein n=1 Tax=Coprococcus catus TaxID=116085 RepID=UPI001C8CE3D1|nr:transglutaminase domain-containing protein [Coprococcus catus]MBX9232149.1 hypothetical protein [Coprococcus catus]MCT6801072.1 hypothetical protein [Coprococcus catus]